MITNETLWFVALYGVGVSFNFVNICYRRRVTPSPIPEFLTRFEFFRPKPPGPYPKAQILLTPLIAPTVLVVLRNLGKMPTDIMLIFGHGWGLILVVNLVVNVVVLFYVWALNPAPPKDDQEQS